MTIDDELAALNLLDHVRPACRVANCTYTVRRRGPDGPLDSLEVDHVASCTSIADHDWPVDPLGPVLELVATAVDDALLERLAATAPTVAYQLSPCHHRGVWHADVPLDGDRPELGQARPCYWCLNHGADAARTVSWVQPGGVDEPGDVNQAGPTNVVKLGGPAAITIDMYLENPARLAAVVNDHAIDAFRYLFSGQRAIVEPWAAGWPERFDLVPGWPLLVRARRAVTRFAREAWRRTELAIEVILTGGIATYDPDDELD